MSVQYIEAQGVPLGEEVSLRCYVTPTGELPGAVTNVVIIYLITKLINPNKNNWSVKPCYARASNFNRFIFLEIHT